MFHAMLFLGRPAPRENKFFGGIDIFQSIKNIKEMGQILAWIPHAEGREGKREGDEQEVTSDCGFGIFRCFHFDELTVCTPGR